LDWSATFCEKSALFWPIAPAARTLAGFDRWPDAEELTRALAAAPVRFELAAPRPRRGRASAPTSGYDARITEERTVPTRARSWHDLLNALVWATFPCAKTALHARQHRLIAQRAGDDGRVPSARSPEQDAVAMLDEGGLILLCTPAKRVEIEGALAGTGEASHEVVRRAVEGGVACPVLFGHALYEGLACSWGGVVRAAGYVVETNELSEDTAARVAVADRALSLLLERAAPITHADLQAVVLGEHLVPSPLRSP
jgi:hypothetical protein